MVLSLHLASRGDGVCITLLGGGIAVGMQFPISYRMLVPSLCVEGMYVCMYVQFNLLSEYGRGLLR